MTRGREIFHHVGTWLRLPFWQFPSPPCSVFPEILAEIRRVSWETIWGGSGINPLSISLDVWVLPRESILRIHYTLVSGAISALILKPAFLLHVSEELRGSENGPSQDDNFFLVFMHIKCQLFQIKCNRTYTMHLGKQSMILTWNFTYFTVHN